jgi:hypothetical protein
MKFEYMNAISQEDFIINWERSLNSSAYYVFLNGSYGDIFTFLSMFCNFHQKTSNDILIFCEKRWVPLVQRFLKSRVSITIVENFWPVNNALSLRINNALGQIREGSIFMSCVTCHPNLPELIVLNYLDHADCYKYLLHLPRSCSYIPPPDRELYELRAREHLGVLSNSPKKKALLSFSTTSSVEQPIEFLVSIVKLLQSRNYLVAFNSTDSRPGYNKLSELGALSVTIPPEMPGEIIDNFDVFITAYNGLAGNAMLSTRHAKLLIIVPNIIETKTNDWSMPHSYELLDFQHKSYCVNSDRVKYLIGGKISTNIEKFMSSSSTSDQLALFKEELEFISDQL